MRMTPAFEFKSDGLSGDGTFAGYASAFFGPPDCFGHIIRPGAFRRTLSEHKAAGTTPALLWAHDQAQPIGVFTKLLEDPVGLAVEGKLTLGTVRAREAYALLRDGAVTGLSIGYTVAPDGIARDGDNAVMTDVDLHEISLTALPANRRARITDVKSLDARALEGLLRSSGLPKSATRALMAHGMRGLNGTHEAEEIAAAVAAIKTANAKLKGFT